MQEIDAASNRISDINHAIDRCIGPGGRTDGRI